jgi:xanthine dehydrogenase accessory factor
MMRPVQQTAARVTEWLREGRRVAAGTLVAVDGSSPLDVGASVYIDADGTIEGSVTGGCVESAVAQEAMAMLEGDLPPKLVTYGISDELAGTVGLMCGGIVHIFIHVLRDETRDAMLAGLAAIQEERPAALATLLDGEHAGAKLYVDASTSIGTLGGPALLDSNAAQEARGLTIQGRSTVRASGEDGASLGSGMRVHVAAFAEPPRMVIFGAIDFASALVRVGAFLGYRVTVCDARPVFATKARFPEADEVVVEWPHRYLERTGTDARTVLCVLTHDAKFDVPLLRLALRLPVAYVGAMGSRRTHLDRNERLREVGVTELELARLRSPIGLDLGARTPEETALSIAAEIVANRRGGSGVSLTGAHTPIHHDAASASASAPAGRIGSVA